MVYRRVESHSAIFHQALSHHEAGELDLARRLLEKAVRMDPHHAEAWHRLGLIERQSGRPEEAVERISRAVALDAGSPDYHRDLGTVYLELGRPDEAIESLQHALDLAPGDATLHFNLGVVLHAQGNLIGAKLRFEQATKLRPTLAPAWHNLGMINHLNGDLDAAAVCLSRAHELEPDRAESWFLFGNIRLAQNRPLEAIAAYTKTLERQPQHAPSLNNLGTALWQLGRVSAALDSYRLATRIDPAFAAPFSNLGLLLASLGRSTEAEAAFKVALALEPGSPANCNNLASLFQSLERLDEAEPLLRSAIAADRDHADAWANLAGLLQVKGDLDEATKCYRRAQEIRPANRLLVQAALALPPIYESSAEMARRRGILAATVAQLAASGMRLDPACDLLPVNFLLAYQGLNDRALAASISRLCAAGPTETRPPKAKPEGGRLRVGFLSKFLRDHTIGDLNRGVISRLDRDQFHVTILSIGDHDDETVRGLKQRADAYVVLPESVPLARRLVAEAELDLLVYPEIGMDPLTKTLAHSRLAPVQCASWGHPVTSGIPTIDYFVSSVLVEPQGAQSHYTEKLWLMESLLTCYERPQLRGAVPPRRALCLPDEGPILLCPQSLFKFHPDFDVLLAEILARSPTGKLVLIDAPHRSWNERLKARFQSTLRGLENQVHFVPRVSRDEFLHLVALADVVLDPLHFGGGNTSFQALGLGVPVVTLSGAYMRGRVTAGCYARMGIHTCVAADPADYIEIAVRLAADREFYAHAKDEIARCSGLLFDSRHAVDEWQSFFRMAVSAASIEALRAA